MMSNWLSRTIELRSTSKSQEQFLGPRIVHLIGELIGKISISTPNIYLAKGEGLLMNTDNTFDKTDRCKRTTPTILGGSKLFNI